MQLVGLLNGVVTMYVANELATAERSRSLPWSEEQENAVRIAYLGSQIAGGAYPRMAAAFMEDPGPIDLDAVFDMALAKVLEPSIPNGVRAARTDLPALFVMVQTDAGAVPTPAPEGRPPCGAPPP